MDGLSIAGGENRFLVRDAGFRVEPGRLLALTGPSGSGKTTLLRALLGVLPPETSRRAGRVEVLGSDVFALSPEELRELRRTRIAFVGQDPGSSLNPRMRVRTLVRELAPDPTAVSTLLREVRLPADADFATRRPGALSGGQQRRVALARALARHPDLLLLDEPTAGLHPALRDEIGDLLLRLSRDRNLAVVFACHDTDLVSRIADEVHDLTPPHSPSVVARAANSGRNSNPSAARAPAEVAESPAGEPDSQSTTDSITAGAGESTPMASENGDRVLAPAIDPPGSPDDAAASHAAVADETPAVASADSRPDSLLVVRGLRVWSGGAQVVRDIDLVVAAGASAGIVGPSGAGKTSLVRAMVGLQPAGAGVIEYAGRRLRPASARRKREERRRIQLVPQNPLGALNPSRTVAATLGRPVLLHRRRPRREVPARVAELLDQVGLGAEFAARYPHELSGGQRQRVSIARALAADPDILICDEVTSALDTRTATAIMDLLSTLRARHNLSLVLIAHDLPLIAAHTDTVLVLDAGRPVESGPTPTVFANPSHEVTRALLGASTPAGS
ncbi:ATP-binding cassette domain-containing protein [Nocardia sp. NPDC005978]|uniref:ABC transporter ATP-binding protein n=1 Tax=Nocardia sp. NPDC005978 TaxID=3156725 RepID=UPI0033B2A962